MTREETIKIIRIMVDSYPNYKPSNLSETVDVWTLMLEEYSYSQVSTALKTYILTDTSGFAPTIGQLVDKIHSISQPEQLNEMEAWALVANALRRSAYNSLEEYAKLPPAVQKAVGTHEQLRNWGIDDHFNEEVAKSNFLRAYRTEINREKEFSKMPKEVRQLIGNASVGSYKALIDEKRQQSIKLSSERKQAETMAIEKPHEGVPMPEKLKKMLEKWKAEKLES